MRHSRFVVTRLSLLLVGILLINNSMLTHAVETNFWKDRAAKASPLQLAQLPLSSLSSIPAPKALALTNTKTLKDLNVGRFNQRIPSLISTLNSSSGRVRQYRASTSPNSKTIVLLQDIHLNREAQSNLSQALKTLIDQRKISLLALEGTEGPINLAPFHQYEHPALVEKTANYLLEKNEISGPLHAALLTPLSNLSVVGIDNARLHKKNIEAYVAAQNLKKEAHRHLTLWNKMIDEKNSLIGTTLASFKNKLTDFHRGKISLSDYLSELQTASGSHEPLFEAMIEASAMEQTLNFNAIQAERMELMARLVNKNDPKLNQTLISLSSAFKLGQIDHKEFYSELFLLLDTHQIALSQYKNMSRYIQYVLLVESIDPELLMTQISITEKSAIQKLSTKSHEKTLMADLQLMLLTEKLVDFSLTRDEWKQYQSLKQTNASNELLWSQFERFYVIAEARDHEMASNIAKAMNTDNNQVGALVCGGFHTKGVTDTLQKRGYSILIFSPQTSEIGPEGSSNYLGMFAKEKTPLELLFRGQQLFLPPDPKIPLGKSAAIIPTLIVAQGQSPEKSLQQLVTDRSVSVISYKQTPDGAKVTYANRARQSIETHVKTDTQLNIIEFTVSVMTNTNLLALGITWLLSSAGILNINGATLIGTFFLIRLGLIITALFEEFVQMAVDGYFKGKPLLEIPKTFMQSLIAENLNLSGIVTGNEMKGIHFRARQTTDQAHIRKVGESGPLSNLTIALLGALLSTSSTFHIVGLVFLSTGLLLWTGSFLFGTDRLAMKGIPVTAYTCGIFGFFAWHIGEAKYMIDTPHFKQLANTLGIMTQKRGAQSAGIMKTVIVPTKVKWGWKYFHPYLYVKFRLLERLGYIQLPSLQQLSKEGFTQEEIESLSIDHISEEDRLVHLVTKRMNTRRGNLIGRMLDYETVLYTVADFCGYQPVGVYEARAGHTRYATGSKTKLKNAHPHGRKPRLVKQWKNGTDNKLKRFIRILDTKGFHNGDLNGVLSAMANGHPIWKVFGFKEDGTYHETGEIKTWLEKISGEKIDAEGDTPVLIALVDFLIAQGMWFQSSRVAYQLAISESLEDSPPSDAVFTTFSSHIAGLRPLSV